MGADEEVPVVKFNPGKRFGEWVIVRKLDEGGFGQVYKVESNKTKGKVAAMKAESNDVEGGSAIKLELSVLRTMTEDGNKPFVPEEDMDRARLVHILDFGLARSFATKNKDTKAKNKWVARRARGTAEFRGTLRYCSPNVHLKKEQGRGDDLISLLYVLIELHCGLPWQTVKDKTKVETLKVNVSDEVLVLNFPVELHPVMPHLRSLDCYQRPNYTLFYSGLVAVMKRLNVKASDPYDWETKEGIADMLVKHPGPDPWENATDFFASDPIGINGPPAPGTGETKSGNHTMEAAKTVEGKA